MHSIKDLFQIEPKLKQVVEFAKMPFNKDRHWCIIYNECKMKFINLVGFFAYKEELRTPEDYNLFIKYILDIIENNCKNEEDEECQTDI